MTFKKYLTLPLLLIIALVSAQDFSNKKMINVLFIGNKMTYNHNMLTMLQEMIDESHMNIKIDHSVYTNFNLSDHLEKIILNKDPNYFSTREKNNDSEKTSTELKLQEKEWDIVILQPSFKQILIDEARKFKVNKSITAMKKIVDNPNCKFYLYGTTIPNIEYFVLGGLYGHMLDDSLEPMKIYKAKDIGRFDKTMKTFNTKLNLLSQESNTELINMGDFIYETKMRYPKLNLYDLEENTRQEIYMSKEGSFFNACVFYKVLTGQNVSELAYNSNLKKSIAKKIKHIVDENYTKQSI